jgi:hypothetical protein
MPHIFIKANKAYHFVRPRIQAYSASVYKLHLAAEDTTHLNFLSGFEYPDCAMAKKNASSKKDDKLQ